MAQVIHSKKRQLFKRLQCHPFDRNCQWVVWMCIMLLIGKQYSAVWMTAFSVRIKLMSCSIGQDIYLIDRIHVQMAGMICSEWTLHSCPNVWVCSKCSTFLIWLASLSILKEKVPYIYIYLKWNSVEKIFWTDAIMAHVILCYDCFEQVVQV